MQFKLSIRMKKKVEEQEQRDEEMEAASGLQQKSVDPSAASQAEAEKEPEERVEEMIKIVLTNDEIDPEDIVEKDPRKALSLK